MNANIFDFNLRFDKMTLDGALFDLAKVENICKERLSRLNKEEFTKKAYDFAKQYDNELKELIERDVEFFKSIINIEREKENPRKDYEKFSDILPLIKFFYNEYYDEMVKELVFPENLSEETIKKVLKAYVEVFDLELSEEDWFAQMKEVAVSQGFAANAKEFKKNKEAFLGHVTGDIKIEAEDDGIPFEEKMKTIIVDDELWSVDQFKIECEKLEDISLTGNQFLYFAGVVANKSLGAPEYCNNVNNKSNTPDILYLCFIIKSYNFENPIAKCNPK